MRSVANAAAASALSLTAASSCNPGDRTPFMPIEDPSTVYGFCATAGQKFSALLV